MGFGSYDESEQENQEVSADLEEGGSVSTNSQGHGGSVEFEFTTSNDELLERLGDIKDDA